MARATPLTSQRVDRICHELAGLRFPWDITRSLELALLKTFCVPSISGLLARTGEFTQRPRKRYDDTGLMVAELLRHGPDSAKGRAVIERINRIHGAYAISNRDFLYVLSTFVCEPIRWLARYGWRSLSGEEREALFLFWRRVGERMGMEAIPDSLDAMWAFNTAFETEAFATAETNRQVANATRSMLLRDWPAPLRPALELGVSALLDPPVTQSLRWQAAPAWLHALTLAALRCRSRLANSAQAWRPSRQTRFYSQRSNPSYGRQFQLEQLGPPAMLDRLNRRRWRGNQRRIGLTGGIATGKSTVARMLRERFALPVLDADAYAREALAPGSAGAKAVLARYGEAIVLKPAVIAHPPPTQESDVIIDRAALGRIVFNDPAERRWLEDQVHPLVRQRFSEELERLAKAPVVVLMIPLLFEAGLESLCTEIWVVSCEAAEQRRRLMERDHLTPAEADARMEAQWPLVRKRQLADRVIDNSLDHQHLIAQITAILE
jgi:dephospho-CoA kinase